jgi:hypothetical protein
MEVGLKGDDCCDVLMTGVIFDTEDCSGVNIEEFVEGYFRV